MRTSIKLVAFGVAALLLGLVLASPLISTNLRSSEPAPKYSGGRAKIDVEVVYAYFSLQPFNHNITGLWLNASNPSEVGLGQTNYLIILKVTNLSNVTTYMDRFEVEAAEFINITTEQLTFRREVRSRFLESILLTSGESDRTASAYPTATRWAPHETRLVALSGLTEVANMTRLRSGTFYLGCVAEGTPIEGVSGIGGDAKQVQMEVFGSELLYNDLLAENQFLRFTWDGMIAYIDERQ